MPSLQSLIRAGAERGVELVAAFNRARLPKTESPFLVGVHAPMRSELSLHDLPVTGSIPAGSDPKITGDGTSAFGAKRVGAPTWPPVSEK